MQRRAFAMVATIFLVDCSSAIKHVSDDDLIIRAPFSMEVPERISESAIREDMEMLIYAIESGYGGRKYLPKGSLDAAIANLHKISDSASTMRTSANFCEEIARIFFELPDNHLAAKLDGKDCHPEREKLFSRDGLVGKNIAKQRNKPWELNYRRLNGMRIPVLSITSFPNGQDKVWNGFLDTVFELKRHAPSIIIDLRGNGGGDDTMALKMASYLYGQDFQNPMEAIIKSQTPATFALSANSYALKAFRLRLKGEEVSEYLLARSDKYLRSFEKAKKREIPEEKSEPGDAGKPFDPKKAFTKPIFLLVDRGCMSSCESTLEAFEAHPHAVTVGENTGGFIHFGNMGNLLLPNSKIVIQLATDYWKRRDGRFLEKIGYEPKIRVLPGQDALDAALAKAGSSLKDVR